jgi:hypothetical protein
MSEKTYLLTFEWNRDDEVLEIHGNHNGFRKLGEIINDLLNRIDKDHTHIMTTEWGGESLSSKKQNPKADLINHVKLMIWPDDS